MARRYTRKMSVRQKRYLQKLFEEEGITCTLDMTEEQIDKLHEMKCFENLLTHADRFLSDLEFKNVYGV